MRYSHLLDGAAAITMIAAGVCVIWMSAQRFRTGAAQVGGGSSLPPGSVSISGVPVRGSETARVVLVEYSDFECNFCRSFARETLPELDRQYIQTGKVRFAFHVLPLRNIHPRAHRLAAYAVCAQRQARFWAMHDELFAGVVTLDEPALDTIAQRVGLNTEQLQRCLDEEAPAVVWRRVAEAAQLGVRATPTFFVGILSADGSVRPEQRISGAQSASVFRESLDAVLGRVAERDAGKPESQ